MQRFNTLYKWIYSYNFSIFAKKIFYMDFIRDFSQIISSIKLDEGRKCVGLVCPSDEHSEYVVERCVEEGLANFILFTEPEKTDIAYKLHKFAPDVVKVTECESSKDASTRAVEAARLRNVDVLMKGLVSTDVLLKAVLDKENGILPKGRILTHIAAAEIPSYDHLLFFSDAAVIPRPTTEHFDAMIKYNVDLCHKMGIKTPRIALIHFTEKNNPKFENTVRYAEIKQMAESGRYGSVIIDGPMDVKSACDISSCNDKGIISPINGRADVLIMPNIESGNVFYKTLTLFAGAINGGILSGTDVPIVVTSRADSGLAKYYSLALACKA